MQYALRGLGYIGMTILYLEENEGIRRFVGENLQRIAQKVVMPSDADEAIEFFKQHKPDVVITTLSDAVGDWSQFLRHVKRSKPETLIIATARFFDESVVLKALDIGINKFFIKPTMEKLKGALLEFDEMLSLKRYAEEYETFLFQYKQAIDVAALVMHLDSKLTIVYVNQGFCSTFGYSEYELIGKNILEYLNFTRKDIIRIKRELEKNKIYKGVVEFISKSKKSFVIESTIFPMQNSYGKIVELVSISHDVTQIREDVWTNLRSVFDSDSSPIIVVDEAFRVVLLNKSILSLLGYTSKDEFLNSGGCICDYFVEKDGFITCSSLKQSNFERPFEEFIVYLASISVKKEQKKVMIKNVEGKFRVFTVHLSSILNRFFGEHVYNILTFVDITELERLKEEQINNIKLTSIGKLAAGITHEINTPLTYMKGNLEMLELELRSEYSLETYEMVADLFENIKDGSRRIENIVESMKEIAGATRREKKLTNLYSTLIYAMRMVYHRAKQISTMYINGKLFALELSKDEEFIEAQVEPQRVEQVWIVILNNALDELNKNQMPFEDKKIEVFIEKLSAQIVVKIKDNAGGIPPHLMSSLFDMFTSTKQHSGMGVGLNIAKSIVDDHNGKISAYNVDGGAIFEVIIPL